MKVRLLPRQVLFALVLLATCAAANPVGAAAPPKVIVIAWDGTVPTFVHGMIHDGKLPNLAKLIATGAMADDVKPVYPSLTAPGFASLWSGAPPAITGISGNRISRSPQSQFTILESVLGFNFSLMRADTIFRVAQRAGRKIITLHVPFAGENSQLSVHFRGYSGIAGRESVITAREARPRRADGWRNLPHSLKPPLEISFRVGNESFYGLLVADPSNPQTGYNAVFLTATRDANAITVKLKSGPPTMEKSSLWSGPISIKTGSGTPASTYLRLFRLEPDGSDFLLYHTVPVREVISPEDLLGEASPVTRAFIANGLGLAYRQGLLGKSIPDGGDGTAEARYLETVKQGQRQLMETARWVFDTLAYDLLVAYSPYPDEAEHLWRGYLDAGLPNHRPAIAERLRPFLEQVYGSLDEMLGEFIERRPENSLIALVSDHGMEATNTRVAINAALQQGGLLTLDEKGRPDLAKTKALYPSINAGYLLINGKHRKQGIVADDEHAGLVERIREVLSQIRDGGRAVVTKVADTRDTRATLGMDGAVSVDMLSGYEFDPKLGAGEIIERRRPRGTHGFDPERLSMRTLMVFNGPGVKRGIRLRGARLIDFAPTLARLIGLPAPTDATGQVLEDALAEPR